MIVRILAVDDEEEALTVIQESFQGEKGYRVSAAKTGNQALEAIYKDAPDLVILDWNLPDRSGYDICRLLRKDPKTAGIPILMLTAVQKLKQKVDALEAGADDYMIKPFQVLELKARVRAVLRRKTPWLVQTRPLEFKDLRIDPATYKAYVQQKDAGLTKVEFEILYLLAVNAGRTVSRAYIENRALDMEFPRQSRALDVHLAHIRDKLGPKASARIETQRGLGYLFAGDEYAR